MSRFQSWWIALVLLAPWAAHGQGLFATRPTWTSPISEETTYDLAFGDVDRDGDLDLVTASLGEHSSLYLNEGRRLARTRAWKTSFEDSSYAVALGDLNRDGFLDVVFGGPGGVRCFRGNGTAFEDEPFSTIDEFAIHGVALGDVDRDGDLDLVCAGNGRSTLYRNTLGDFESTPIWESPPGNYTSAALGQVSRDNRLDLVLGSWGGRNALFLNDVNNGFESLPAWEADSLEATAGVALGDLDADGLFDLVCANAGTAPCMYRNVDGNFSRTATWRADLTENLSGVALGDMDLDGDLDLAFGHNAGGINPERGSFVFLNDGDSLRTRPDWESDDPTHTTSVALADVNADGDLDFVCGNTDIGNFVYDGIQALFPGPPIWRGNDLITDYAIGDVDLDGDLDLIGGHIRSSTAFYRNDGGNLGRDPAWMTNRPDATRSVTLGDVDGDGDLDLVCGNNVQSNALWLFDQSKGVFGSLPAWESPGPEGTLSVALGDLDSDGDPDLLCGNEGRCFILRNDAGTFEPTPLWIGDPIYTEPSVAIGDINQDGWLDIVIASSSGTHLYHNDRGRFPAQPTWALESPETTRDIALGDMDGDGDLDLVCASYFDRNSVYRNVDGVFESVSSWLPEPSLRNIAMALGDVDADGDLDVFTASDDPLQSQLYLNSSAGLDDEPAWTSSIDAVAIACGDIDADGDLDVVAGTNLLPGTSSPAGGFDPNRGPPRLPNEPAQVRQVHVATTGENTRSVAFRTFDAESDSVWLVAEYQEAGSATSWHPVVERTIVPPPLGVALGPYSASPQGEDHRIVWDLSSLLYGRFDLVLRLRPVSYSGLAGEMQIIPSHLTPIGTVEVRQPFMQFTGLDHEGKLQFPAVTVGDTATALIQVENLGNDTLRVHNITPSAPDRLRIEGRLPFDIAPGSARSVRADYFPVELPQEDGTILVHSNDPTRPFFTLDLRTPTLELKVRTQVLSIEDTVQLAQALTIQALPENDVFVEQATLFHRFRGSDAVFAAIPMQLLPGETALDGPRLANLQADAVTEVGLEYYVKLENSGIVATDPPGAPGRVYEIDVQPPEDFNLTALQTSTSGYLAGRDVVVVANVPTGASFVSGTLFWRRGGASSWNEEPLLVFEFGDAIATIPDSAVGERGLEFYARMQTRTNSIQSPHEGASVPDRLQVRVPNLKEPVTHPGGRYRMASMPLDMDDRDVFLDELLADGEGFGPYDPTRWRLFRYDPVAQANIEFTHARLDLFEPKLGDAFWLISRPEHRIDTAPVEGASTSTSSGRQITLAKGWNQIGNPFAFPVAWSSVEATMPIAPPVAFDPNLGTSGGYVDEPVEVLQPFEGYFVHNSHPDPLILTVPPVEAVALKRSAAAVAASHWWMRLSASNAGAIDSSNRFGVDASAADAGDVLDAPEPPPAPGDWVQLAFVQETHRLRHDMRAPAEGHAWDVEVRAAARGAEVHLAATPANPLPADLELRLLDLELGTTVTLGAEDYSLIAFGSQRPYRLRILAGSAAWVERAAAEQLALPTSFIADRAAPNPFRDATRFRFGIPQAAPVALEIYDVRGSRVATLADGSTLPAGYHVRIWNGEDHAGRGVANGIYFARLRAGDRTTSWRLTVLR